MLLLWMGGAQAQTSPDAGTLLQQIERGRGAALPRPSVPQVAPLPQPMRPRTGITVTVSAFRFAGNTLLDAEVLASAVTGFLNRPLDFTELQQAAAAVAEAYRKAGWIVRTYLPQQEIKDGVVTIQIVEAVFGRGRFEGDPPRRVATERLLPMIEAAQPEGAPLQAEALDRALLLLDDLPGITVAGSLVEGRQDRETDLLLKVADEVLVSGEVGADNAGARSTGGERLTGNVYFNSPLGLGDQLIANLLHTQGSDYGRLAFTLPVGADGWRMGANASTLSYKLIASEFAALDARGTSSTAGVEAICPLIRSRLRNLYLGLNYDDKRFDNQSGGATTTRYKISGATVSLNGNLFDNLGGGGANVGSLALVGGWVDLDGSSNRATDAATTQTAGSFTKLRYAISRQQVVTEVLSLYAALSGQVAGKNLDSAEKFYLGGASGVRAYPANEGGGAEGQLVNLELRYRLPQNVTFTGFYDWGHVIANRNNDFTGAATVNDYNLKGIGLTVGWLPTPGLSLKATWARRIGGNPNPTAAGNDQDGSLVQDRFWLQAILSF